MRTAMMLCLIAGASAFFAPTTMLPLATARRMRATPAMRGATPAPRDEIDGKRVSCLCCSGKKHRAARRTQDRATLCAPVGAPVRTYPAHLLRAFWHLCASSCMPSVAVAPRRVPIVAPAAQLLTRECVQRVWSDVRRLPPR